MPILRYRRLQALLYERTSACAPANKDLLVQELRGHNVRGMQEGRSEKMRLSQSQGESAQAGVRVLWVLPDRYLWALLDVSDKVQVCGGRAEGRGRGHQWSRVGACFRIFLLGLWVRLSHFLGVRICGLVVHRWLVADDIASICLQKRYGQQSLEIQQELKKYVLDCSNPSPVSIFSHVFVIFVPTISIHNLSSSGNSSLQRKLIDDQFGPHDVSPSFYPWLYGH